MRENNADPKQPSDPGAAFTTAIFARIGVDRYIVTESAVGPVCVGWTVHGVSAVRLAGTAQREAAFADWYAQRVGRRVVRAVEADPIARAAQTKLADARAADVALDFVAATEAERRMLGAIARIPRGYARPLELITREVPDVPVETLVADNPLPLLVPCHRVIHEDRCCGGDYVFGASAQARLLASEGLDIAAIDALTQRGVRYIDASDGSFCLPSCGDIARRVSEPGYVLLHSLAEVRARGLRACEQCRPVAA